MDSAQQICSRKNLQYTTVNILSKMIDLLVRNLKKFGKILAD